MGIFPFRWGNPYGLPVPFIDPNGAPRDSLSQELPIGSVINVRAVTSSKNQQLFEALALKLWPKSSETPDQCGHEEYISIEKRLMPHFDQFADLVNPNELVEASIHWPSMSVGSSTVCEIKNDDFGIVEVSILGKKFYCFFHRTNVWLRDGKRGVEVRRKYSGTLIASMHHAF